MIEHVKIITLFLAVFVAVMALALSVPMYKGSLIVDVDRSVKGDQINPAKGDRRPLPCVRHVGPMSTYAPVCEE
jgi:hypothetical protein